MSADHSQEYDDSMVLLLEQVWGDGYLSPGGPDEIRKIVEGVDFADKSVLDVGCGTGGIGLFLVETYGPAKLTGLDVDQGLIDRASKSAGQAGLDGILEYQCVSPGPLPLEDGTFDIVFSKDAMIHIADKESLFAEIYRVMAPGGTLAVCDWMSSTEAPFSPELDAYIELEGLGFGMASPGRYENALTLSGFQNIDMTDRNPWYRDRVTKECEALSGPLYDGLVQSVGQEFTDHSIEVWQALKVVVDRGELRPTHIRARKPEA